MQQTSNFPLFDKATQYAFKCHNDTNHLYDGQPYSFHLNMVDDVILKFMHLIPDDKLELVRSGGRCHDVIEDCRQTYNDVKDATSEEVAELAYALTNEKGKTRAERANDLYYAGITSIKYATFLKLADRIANITHSKNKKSRMLEMYRKEHESFCHHLQRYNRKDWYTEMFAHMDELLKDQA